MLDLQGAMPDATVKSLYARGYGLGGKGVALADLPGKALAQELIAERRAESRTTPMEAIIQAAQKGSLTTEQSFRLISRLWTLERLLYYTYGGWGLEYCPAPGGLVQYDNGLSHRCR